MVDERQYQNMPAQSVNRHEEYLPSTEFRTPIPEHMEEGANLRDYIDVLLRRKWLILAILFLVFLSTIRISASRPITIFTFLMIISMVPEAGLEPAQSQ